jgi:orotate phosphoribosyltransferase-like protein
MAILSSHGGAMDLQARILELEAQVKHLTSMDTIRGERQNEISKSMDFLYEQIQYLRKQSQEDAERSDRDICVTRKVVDVLAERVHEIFYKVFPEAIAADDALDRIVKEAKKKPTA